jgi:hypothetical protein
VEGLIRWPRTVAPTVAPKFSGVIPNPLGSALVVGLVAIEDGRGPLRNRLRASAEAPHVARGRGGPGVADETGDVLHRLVAVHEKQSMTALR